jgi:hypothetical protein
MSDFKNRLKDVRFNPSLMQDVVYDELEQQLAGRGNYDVPDASSPFPFLMEAGVLNTSMALVESEALLRRLYPRMAISPEELYLHMSDTDYLGRFASPAWTHFEVYLSKSEVMAKAVPFGDYGMRKLVIPRATSFTVADITFTMQYPIELRVLSHGGLQVVYDTEHSSPIQTLESNIVDWDLVNLDRDELLVLRVPVGQFKITTFSETLNATSGYAASYMFPDRFYYARVYVSNDNGQWTEIRTTHTEQVYDPTELTAVLQVVGNTLSVKLPLIYNTTQAVDGELRVDIYTTKGPLEMDLGGYQASQFTMHMSDLDNDETYTAPLHTFNRLQAISPERFDGGSSAISFDTLRDRVINNSLGGMRVPITNAQLETELQTLGFSMVTNIDNITNRQFLASRSLPTTSNNNSISAIGCTMGQVQQTLEQLGKSKYVKDNGQRITLTPDILYEYDRGVVTVVTDYELSRITSAQGDSQTRQVNDRRFLYTPFHYVLEATEERFDVRPYYLDQPEGLRKVFVGENETSAMQASVDWYRLARTESGYRLLLKLRSSDQFKDIDDDKVHIQLGYRPAGENNYASLNGTLVGKEDDERVYRFDIDTNFDLTVHGELRTLNFTMYSELQTDFYVPLEADFDISFVVSSETTVGYKHGELDALVQTHLLPEEFMVIGRERMRLRLGYDLTGLWRRNRSLISEASYKRYVSDVPYVYQSTVYERDENGQLILGQDADGNVTYEVKYQAGEMKRDDDGNVVNRHYKGDVVLDNSGQPELIAPRKILREFTLLLFDGKYYFADEPQALAYRDEVPLQVVGWLRNDLGSIRERLLEQSALYLYPTTTMGDTLAVVRDGTETTIPLEQKFYVNYYLKDSAYGNASLRDALSTSTRTIVNEMLGRKTVAISDIIARLKANAGDDVINIEAGGLGGDTEYSVVTIQDDAVRMSLRKRLTILSNQMLSIQDDIDIGFLRHSK